MRKSGIYFMCTGIGMVCLCVMCIHASLMQKRDRQAIDDKRRVVRALQLTDVCLFTEARYTRHLSQADLHTPFQDHPGALEHFPTGSLVAPPLPLRRTP